MAKNDRASEVDLMSSIGTHVSVTYLGALGTMSHDKKSILAMGKIGKHGLVPPY